MNKELIRQMVEYGDSIAGYGELVVLLDYPLQGSECDEYRPALAAKENTSDR